MTTCTKCGKDGHSARICRVTWKKAWPGRDVMRLGLRTKDGSMIELTKPLSPELAARAMALLNDAIRGGGE